MKDRFEVLDIFRGIFVTLIVFYYMSFFSDTPLLNNSFIQNSDLFVDFFFVLSGFVIAHSYRQINTKKNLKVFLKKRVARLVPLHLVMLFVFVVTELLMNLLKANASYLGSPENNLSTFISSLLLLNSVKLPGVTSASWNIPSWSVSAVMISYIVFGGLLFLLHKLQHHRNRNYFFAFIAITAISTLFITNDNYTIDYTFNFGVLRGIAGFFSGVLCLIFFNFIKSNLDGLPTFFFHVAEVLLLLSIGIYIYRGEFFKTMGYIYEVVFFVSVFMFAFERGFISTLLKRSFFLKNLGKYSYSIYMVQALVLTILNVIFIHILHFQPSAYAYLFIVNCFVIYKVAQWSYKNIEMRYSWKNKIARRRAAIYANKTLAA
ncbi:MAG: acyltransferase [Panacibacter sp.]